MNLLKKFVRNDNADLEEDYDDIYVMPEDLKMEMPGEDGDVATVDSSLRKEPDARPAAPDKVALKLLQPKSHTEATKIADRLKEGSIVLLDISNLTKDQARRLVDFLAGVAYSIGGQFQRVANNTFIITPRNVEVSEATKEEASDDFDGLGA